MQVSVKLSRDLVPAMRSTRDSGAPEHPEAEALRRGLQQLGVQLLPMHPGIDDPELATWFIADAPDPDRLNRLLTLLHDINGVEAAYSAPQPEPP